MKTLLVEESSFGFAVCSKGSDDAVVGEDVFIALGRYFVYFPEVFGASVRLEKGVWRVRKCSGSWVDGQDRGVMVLKMESDSGELISLDELLYLLGTFLYTVRARLDIDIRWTRKPELPEGYGDVISFPFRK